jgi:putative phosphoserine phosphatase/1-acylglycerol-3-phosphate O-acyltransferase
MNVTNPPTIRVRVGPAVELKYKNIDKDTQRIMEAIMALLPAEAHEYHEPSNEELRRTYPSGYKGDPTAETTRRPGTD